jgi:hypothetical protein
MTSGVTGRFVYLRLIKLATDLFRFLADAGELSIGEATDLGVQHHNRPASLSPK